MDIPDAFPVPETEDPFLRVINFQVYVENPNELVLANEMLARIQALLSIQKVSATLRILELTDILNEDCEDIIEEGGEES